MDKEKKAPGFEMLFDVLQIFATRMIMRGANFIVFVLLARSLDLYEFGVYGYLISVLLLVSVGCDLGLRQSSAKKIGADESASNDVFWSITVLWIPLSMIASVIAVLVMRQYPGLDVALPGILSQGGQAPSVAFPLILLLMTAPPVLFNRMTQGVLLGKGRIGAFNRSELWPRAFLLLGIGGLWLIDTLIGSDKALTLHSALWVLAVSYIAGSAALLFETRKLRSSRPVFKADATGHLVLSGLGFALGAIAMIGFGRIGMIMVPALIDGDTAGLYFGFMRLSEMIVEIAMSVGIAIFSHGVRARDDTGSARAQFGIAWAVGMAIAMLALAVSTVAEPLLHLILPAANAVDPTAFHLLLAASVPASMAAMLHQGLAARGQAIVGAMAFAVGSLFLVCLGILWVPQGGIEAMALAYLVAAVLVVVVQCIIYRRKYAAGLRDIAAPLTDIRRSIIGKFSKRLNRASGETS